MLHISVVKTELYLNLPVNGLWASKETENCADYFDDGPHLAEAGPDVGEGVTAESLSTVS